MRSRTPFMPPRRRIGLTVGEVLFVAALAILGALVLYLVASRTSAQSMHRACAENVRSLGEALVMYAQDHDDSLPPYSTMESTLAGRPGQSGKAPTSSDEPSSLKRALRLYVSAGTWYCPADPFREKDVYCLGVRHQFTSYAIPDFREKWASVRKLSTIPLDFKYGLVWDAAGDSSSCDSGSWRGGSAASNHADGMVNYVLSDLSLHTSPASGKYGLLP